MKRIHWDNDLLEKLFRETRYNNISYFKTVIKKLAMALGIDLSKVKAEK